eukprot:m.225541 g.225541  ORF g.225541 m.225541 type:complete len:53 (+) comp15958_c0_seq1:668-826(+)
MKFPGEVTLEGSPPRSGKLDCNDEEERHYFLCFTFFVSKPNKSNVGEKPSLT